MKISALSSSNIQSKAKPSLFDSVARSSVFKLLDSIEGGVLRLSESGETRQFGRMQSEDGIQVQIVVNNPAFYRMVMLRGSIGAAEAYVMNFWQTQDLTDAIRLMCRNMRQIEQMDGGLSQFGLLAQKVRHWLSPNTVTGAKKNIHAHYDLSNALFEAFLDKRMMYSAAMFPRDDADLDTAALYKMQRVGEKLELTPDDHVVEIGSGWGGLAIHLAEQFGCRVTTTTISREQYEFAHEKIRKHDLQDRICLLEKDYRLVEGKFDKLVSIEMIEAVGQQFLPEYFRKCNDLLKTGGKMLIQAITIPEQRYEYARRNMDFIQRYIFPGGSLPSIEAILKNTGKHSQLQLHHMEDIGLDYARTLAEWHHRFNERRTCILDMGFDEMFIRLWQFYLSYCEGGFRERAISTAQLVMRKV